MEATIEASQSCTLMEGVGSTTPDPENDVLTLGSIVANFRRMLIDVDRAAPIGEDATIVAAYLDLVQLGAGLSAGTHNININPVDDDWDSDTVTHATRPAVRALVVNTTVAGATADGTVHRFNITPLVQESIDADDAAGKQWNGVQIQAAWAGEQTIQFHGAFSDADFRPVLTIEWTTPPDPPDELVPNFGKIVSTATPLLMSDFFDEDEEDTISAYQVQVDDVDDFVTPTWDPGYLTTDAPERVYAGAAIPENTTRYWRARVKDNHGKESEWSDIAWFQWKAKGSVAFTFPGAPGGSGWTDITTPVPVFVWTVTGAAQLYVELEVEMLMGGIWAEHWLYPKTVHDDTVDTPDIRSIALPIDYRLEAGPLYRVTLRNWDATDREEMPDDPSYREASRMFKLVAPTLVA